MINKHSLIRTIYLYLFALIGLVLLVVGTVNFINMALKAYVFTQAEEQERFYNKRPLLPEGAEREVLEEINEDFDPIISRRHREASRNLSMIIVGLPLFLYHWAVIRREIRRKEE